MIAAKEGYHKIVETLVEHKASTEVKDYDGKYRIFLAYTNLNQFTLYRLF